MKQCSAKVNKRNFKAAGAQSRRLRRRWKPRRVQTVASEQTTTPSQPAFLTFSSITQRHVYLSLLLPNYRVETERGRASGAPQQLARERIWMKMLQKIISWEMKGQRRTASYFMMDSCVREILSTHGSSINWSGAELWRQRIAQLCFPGNIWTQCVNQTALKHKSNVERPHWSHNGERTIKRVAYIIFCLAGMSFII